MQAALQTSGAMGPVATAQALLTGGQTQAALATLLPVLSQYSDDPAALDCAAMCYWRLGDGPTAYQLMQVITQAWPDLPAAWNKQSAMAAGLGMQDAAEQCLRQALRLQPRSVSTLVALNRIAPFPRSGALARRLKGLARGPGLSGAEREMALNALARIDEKDGRYEQAFRGYAAAKAARAGEYDPTGIEARLTAQIARQVQPAATGGLHVVFVTGMPRSGTTLVEQILTRHPKVVSVGESHALAQVSAAFPNWDGAEAPQQAEAAQAQYLKLLGPAAQDGAVIVDKMPLNILGLDFARWMLPNARFLFMDRHPMDVGLSCFTTNFFEGNGFSRKLDWIGHLTRQVFRSAEDHLQKMPQLRWQSYRALVEQPEPQIRAMLSHADLPFHADCLHPEAGQGGVRTASLFQVREGINRSGLDKWHRYQAQLVPLQNALGAEWLQNWRDRDAAAD